MLAVLEGWHISDLDVRTAFLYSDLEEEIYMDQPEGMPLCDDKWKVLRLRKALYGLKQAGNAWWQAVQASLEELQFTNTNANQGVFVYRKGDDLCLVILYIDNAIFLSNNPDIVMELKGKFMLCWEC
jgi:hypothetical protein